MLRNRHISLPKTGTVKKTTNNLEGKYIASFIKLTKRPAVEGEPYSVGLDFVKTMKDPGVLNDQVFDRHLTYAGQVSGLAAMVNGVIADSDLESIEDQIIELAKLDSERVGSESYVNLRRAYVVTNSDYTDASGFNVNLEDGTTKTFVTASTFTAGQMAIQFNANTNVNTKLVCLRIDTERYLITSFDPFYKFTIDTPVDSTIDERYIYAENKDPEYAVHVQYELGKATTKAAHIVVLDGTTRTTTALSMYIDGTNHAIAGSATLATLVAQFATAAATDHGVFAVSDANSQIWIYAPDSVNTFALVLGDTNTLTLVKQSSPNGGYAYLTVDDIFRQFMGRGSKGVLGAMSYVDNQPIQGGKYRKYILTTQYDHPNTEGPAGSFVKTNMVVELYVLLSQALASKFKSDGGRYMDDSTPSGADTSLDALITAWLS